MVKTLYETFNNPSKTCSDWVYKKMIKEETIGDKARYKYWIH